VYRLKGTPSYNVYHHHDTGMNTTTAGVHFLVFTYFTILLKSRSFKMLVC